MGGKREDDENRQSGPRVSSYVLRDVHGHTSCLLAGDRPDDDDDAPPVPASLGGRPSQTDPRSVSKAKWRWLAAYPSSIPWMQRSIRERVYLNLSGQS